MRPINVAALVFVVLVSAGCSRDVNAPDLIKASPAKSAPPLPDYTALYIASPFQFETSRDPAKPIYIQAWGIPIGHSTAEEIPGDCMTALYDGISLVNIGTGEPVPYKLNIVSEMWETLYVVPLNNLVRSQSYKIAMSTHAFSGGACGNIKVFGTDLKEVKDGHTAVVFNTFSSPSVSRVTITSISNEAGFSINIVVLTFSEPLRVGDLRDNPRAGFFIDDKEVIDCIEPNEDCGLAALIKPGAKRAYNTLEIDGKDVMITQEIVFVIPEGTVIGSSMKFVLYSGAKGISASLSEGVIDGKRARIDGDFVVFSINLSEMTEKQDLLYQWIYSGE